MKPSLLFLTLKVFSETGGIEKVSRVAGKALHELAEKKGFALKVLSAYDETSDIKPRYFTKAVFSGFGGKKARFALEAIRVGQSASVVLLSHINLLPIGYAIKKLSPQTKLVLLAHGIEVWRPLPAWRRRMLQACNRIVAVSRYTEAKMINLYGLNPDTLTVLNNCLDPFLPRQSKPRKSSELLRRYGFAETDKIILTLSRLSHKERYKGYDEILMALKTLKQEHGNLRYLIVGKYDQEEKTRLDRFIRQQGLQDQVVMAGFIPDRELPGHFNLADLYAMPSRKEGFGIVFIEALYYGLPVIAGNLDGSVDALAGGELGWLVNPDRPGEILAALKNILRDTEGYRPPQAEVVRRFGFSAYKDSLWEIVQPMIGTKFPDEELVKRRPVGKAAEIQDKKIPHSWKQS